MNEFKTYHPIVNFTYFIFVIGFSMFFMHPIALAISLVCAFSYSVVLKGRKAISSNLLYMLPMLIFAALINPAFNHEGITILRYLPSGNPLTLESIVYGIAAATMIVSVICHFSCFNEIITSDKFVYLFGRIIPSLSLILSMTLRFIPKFIAHMKSVSAVQKCIGHDISDKNIIKRIKYGVSILSSTVTWALENAVETSDSMRSRGYGTAKRTAFSIFTFSKRDASALLCITSLGTYILIGSITKSINFSYFPYIKGSGYSFFSISVFIAYFILLIIPIIIEVWEVIKWKSIESKI